MARAVKPVMAFSGVRMSWDTLLRKVVFAWLDWFAAWSAFAKVSFFSFSSEIMASIFWKPAMI